jgi:hypothetical protein
MSEYLDVPVEAAKSIAERFRKSIVVILAFDPAHQLTHTTTYGVSAFDKENAAAAGEKCSAAVGCDLSAKQTFADFHNDYEPAFLREAEEILKCISRQQGCNPVRLQQIERWLKARGHGLRQG